MSEMSTPRAPIPSSPDSRLDEPAWSPAADHAVMRVRSRGGLGALGFAAASVAAVGAGMVAVAPLGVLVGAVGLAVAWRWRGRAEWRCSERACGAPLSEEATRCPRCGGTVVGDADSRDEAWAQLNGG